MFLYLFKNLNLWPLKIYRRSRIHMNQVSDPVRNGF